jgi:3-oxoacyl-[acyl-carrier protein] reductase
MKEAGRFGLEKGFRGFEGPVRAEQRQEVLGEEALFERQRDDGIRVSFPKVGGSRFAGASLQVEEIVLQLEGAAEMKTRFLQFCRPSFPSCSQRARLQAEAEEDSGFSFADGEHALEACGGGQVRSPELKLIDRRQRESLHDAGRFAEKLRAERFRESKRTGEQKVAGQHGPGGRMSPVQRPYSASLVGFVHDVVMDEARRVDEFGSGGQGKGIAAEPFQFGEKTEQAGPHVLGVLTEQEGFEWAPKRGAARKQRTESLPDLSGFRRGDSEGAGWGMKRARHGGLPFSLRYLKLKRKEGFMESSLIIGASGGIGRALCRRVLLRRRGLILAGRGQERLESLRDELVSETPGAEIEVREVDARDEAQVIALFEGVKGLDVTELVSLPGSILLKPAHLTSVADFRETFEQNAVSAFMVLREAIRAFLLRGSEVSSEGGIPVRGSIVLLSSVAAGTGLANHEAISAAKGAVEGLVRSAAATYAARGIRVNAVAPGLVNTPLAARLTSNPASLKSSTEMHPMKRIGQPGDVASAIDWLLDSTRSGWVTGQILSVDGGLRNVR